MFYPGSLRNTTATLQGYTSELLQSWTGLSIRIIRTVHQHGGHLTTANLRQGNTLAHMKYILETNASL